MKPFTIGLACAVFGAPLVGLSATAVAASDVDCSNKINPNTMTERDCQATGFGVNTCRLLLDRRDKGARYRSLNDIVNMVRLKFGEAESKCVRRKGAAFKTWIWPKPGCEMTKKAARCNEKTGKMCPRRIEAQGDMATCLETP